MLTILFFIVLWLIYRRKNPERAKPFKKFCIFFFIYFILIFSVLFMESIISLLLNKRLGIGENLLVMEKFLPILPGYFYFLKRNALKENNLERIKACNLGLWVNGIVYLLFPLSIILRKLGEFFIREGVKDMDILYMILGLGFFILFCSTFWRISQKAGYPGILGLVMFVPAVNILLLINFAFSEWPIHKELNRLKKVNS